MEPLKPSSVGQPGHSVKTECSGQLLRFSKSSVFNHEASIGFPLNGKPTCSISVYYFGFSVKTESTEVYSSKGREKKKTTPSPSAVLPLLAAPTPAA
jgi:hypothetical protein